MLATAVESPSVAGPQPREPAAVACCFKLGGDLRFLSHHDELRMLTRALTRAGWPLAYSRGFNPRPRVVLPLPRRVGIASDCQWAVVQLDDAPPLERLHDSLEAALPAACSLRRVVALPPRAKPHPRRVVFELELEARDARQVTPRIARMLAAEELIVERTYGPERPAGRIDIRPFIETITLDGCKLSLRLVFVQQRTARPSEVLKVLCLPVDACSQRVRQVEVEWDMALGGPACRPPGAERNDVGQEENRYAQAKDHNA